MRRAARVGLIVLIAFIVLAGGYTAYWFVVADQIEDGVGAWAQSERRDNIDVSWQKIRVTGFPLAFRVELENAALRDGAIVPSPEFYIPILSGMARPWDFTKFRLRAQDGFSAEIMGAAERAPAKIAAQSADGVVWIRGAGGWNLWLTIDRSKIEAAAPIQVGSSDVWVGIPPRSPIGSADPKIAFAVSARQVKLPVAIEPFGNSIEELDLGATVTGSLSGGKLADAIAFWRDAGGAIELDNLRLKWGSLRATANGTIALDQELQLEGSFSGAVQGYDQILGLLVDSGRIRPLDASLARIALGLLARSGPDGEPEIRTAFTIRNGQMFLGPAKLGKAPRLAWQ